MTTKEERVKQGIEKTMLAYGYRKEGMKYKEICVLMGVSYTRIRQLIEKAERILARDMRT